MFKFVTYFILIVGFVSCTDDNFSTSFETSKKSYNVGETVSVEINNILF